MCTMPNTTNTLALILNVYFFYVIWVFCLHKCLCMTGQKRVLNSLGPELQMVVSHCVGAGNQTELFYKNTQHFQH